jgi:uncharacterized repeat protein (TIGR01451 family)
VAPRSVFYGTAADVTIDIRRDDPDPVLAGATLTYAVTVTNAGPDATDDVTVTGTAGASVFPSAITPSQGTCGVGSTYSCSLGTLAAGTSATITVVIDDVPLGTVTHDATVTQYAFDPALANNSARDVTMIEASADVTVTATPLNFGQELGWFVNVDDVGPTPATDTVVTLTLPAGTALATSAESIPAGHCQSAGQIVTCSFGTLAASDTVSVVADIVAESAGTYTLLADAESSSPDPNLANNHAQSTVTATSASKLPSSDPVASAAGCGCAVGPSGAGAGPLFVLGVLALTALKGRGPRGRFFTG